MSDGTQDGAPWALWVEPDIEVRALVAGASDGIVTVRFSADAYDAMSWLRGEVPPVLVAVDQHVAGVGGAVLCRAMVASGRLGGALLVATGVATVSSEVARFFDAGARQWLGKPLDAARVSSALQLALARRAIANDEEAVTARLHVREAAAILERIARRREPDAT